MRCLVVAKVEGELAEDDRQLTGAAVQPGPDLEFLAAVVAVKDAAAEAFSAVGVAARTLVRYGRCAVRHFSARRRVVPLPNWIPQLKECARMNRPAGQTSARPSASHATIPDDPRPAGAGTALAGVLARAADRATYERWAGQVEGAGYCARPVRLQGGIDHADTATGELREHYSTDAEPDGVLLKACGTRRASRCPSCSSVYRYDAYHLVAAGLRGGKGVPETVATHPAVFATFTAPSFGRVHVRREQGGTVYPCHAGKLGEHCAHGRRLACWYRHEEGDPRLGLPLCAGCYDYEAAVTWNALASELWRRTTIYLQRALARRLGVSRAEFGRRARVSYAKVAEFQRRGQVHYHAVIRVDGRGTDGAVVAPPAGLTVEVVCAAIREAAASVQAPVPTVAGGWAGPARWGVQLDIRVIGDMEAGGVLSGERVAAYVAKYATKAAETVGPGLDRPIKSAGDLERLQLPEHAARLVRSCWELGGRAELAGLGLRRWAHMLGLPGPLPDQESALLHYLPGVAGGTAGLGEPSALRAGRGAGPGRAAAATRGDGGAGGPAVCGHGLHDCRGCLACLVHAPGHQGATARRAGGAERRCLTRTRAGARPTMSGWRSCWRSRHP